jgi:hypothetical protein
MEMEMEADHSTSCTVLAKDTSPHVCTAANQSSDDVVMGSSLTRRNCNKPTQRRRQRISFGAVHIVQFWPQLGDHPFVSSGCPIALGEPIILEDGDDENTNRNNNANYTTVVDMESYEQQRPSHQRRRSYQLRIPAEERRDMLLTMGHSPREIARQIRNINLLRESMRPSTLRQKQLDSFYGVLVRTATSGTCNYKIQTI